MWDVQRQSPLVTLRSTTEEHVYAAEWCPYRSTLLAAGSRDGVVELWDLNETTVQPVLRIERPRAAAPDGGDADNEEEDEAAAALDPEQLSRDAEVFAVRHIAFSPRCPVMCVCYDNGWVQVHRVRGVEQGLVLRALDLRGFLEVERDRMRAVVRNTKAE